MSLRAVAGKSKILLLVLLTALVFSGCAGVLGTGLTMAQLAAVASLASTALTAGTTLYGMSQRQPQYGPQVPQQFDPTPMSRALMRRK